MCSEVDQEGNFVKIPFTVDEYYMTKAQSMGVCKLSFFVGLLIAVLIWVGFNGFPGLVSLTERAFKKMKK